MMKQSKETKWMYIKNQKASAVRTMSSRVGVPQR